MSDKTPKKEQYVSATSKEVNVPFQGMSEVTAQRSARCMYRGMVTSTEVPIYRTLHPENFFRFIPCFHISIPQEVRITTETATVCAVCNAVHDGAEIQRVIEHKTRIMIDDDHFYCGPHTIMRFYCARQDKHSDTCPGNNANVSLGSTKSACCRRTSCSQYFYSTIRDLQYALKQPYTPIAGCWHAHIDRHFPIYKCIVAMEIVTGRRFDFPIPVQDGLRAGYNPYFNCAIICTNSMAKDEAYAKVIQEAFQGRAMPTIRAITYDVVNSIWSLDMPGNRSDETVALQVARQIHNLAQCLAAMLELRDFDLDFIASGGVTTLAQKIRTGRLLVRERVPVDDSVPLSPEHIIDANQMETGTSGSLPSIEGPTYQCKTSNLREILRVLGRPKKKSKDSKGAKGAKGAKDSEHDSKDAGHDS